MTFIYIFFVSLALQFFLPWWIIGPVAFAFAAWQSPGGRHAFFSGFWAIFSLWVIIALLKSLPNHNLLASRVAQMFMLPKFEFNWVLMLFITGIIGGIPAGLAALTGFYFRIAFTARRPNEVSLQGENDRSRTNIFNKVNRTV